MKRIRLIDSHIHCESIDLLDEGVKYLTDAGIEKMGFVSYGTMTTVNANPQIMLAKHRYPKRIYTFGGIDHMPGKTMDEKRFARELVRQVETLREIGFDGIKLLETKPNRYAEFPHRLHEPVFDPFFSALENARMPIVWHVADPAFFWHEDQAPPWAKEHNWLYLGDRFPTKEQLYDQTLDILARHPRLVAIFAHFFFLSEEFDRAAHIFERFPNVHFDLTPGREMYYDFAGNPLETRAFFERFQDRLIFGSDYLMRSDKAGTDLAWMGESACRFLEGDGPVEFPSLWGKDDETETLQGLNLQRDMLEKIYARNFERLAGALPAPLNAELAVAECRRIATELDELGLGGNDNFARHIADQIG